MPKGPGVIQYPNRAKVCTLCDFFKQEMEQSGRHPVYRYQCHHPVFSESSRIMPINYRTIGDNRTHPFKETPMWCPVLFEKHRTANKSLDEDAQKAGHPSA